MRSTRAARSRTRASSGTSSPSSASRGRSCSSITTGRSRARPPEPRHLGRREEQLAPLPAVAQGQPPPARRGRGRRHGSRVGISNPPYEMIAGICEAQSKMYLRIAAMAPSLHVEHLRTTPLGDAGFSIEVAVENRGYLPTHVLGSATALALDARVFVTAEAIPAGSKSIQVVGESARRGRASRRVGSGALRRVELHLPCAEPRLGITLGHHLQRERNVGSPQSDGFRPTCRQCSHPRRAGGHWRQACKVARTEGHYDDFPLIRRVRQQRFT